MIITVSIPQTHILHTASLTLTSPESSSRGSVVAVVGQPIMTDLRIKHTRRWASPTSLIAAANLTSPIDAIEFVYSVDTNPDTWLIAGQRRAHFSAKEDEECIFPVMLIPLRAGTALLPSVEIRARVPPRNEDKRKGSIGGDSGVVGGEGEDEVLNCETDYLSSAEVVMVVPDVRSSTIGVGEMGRMGSSVWLEAESR
jgi:hypothetical protein